jgi:hypothetical protein
MANKQTFWRGHIDAWRQSGLSQAAYCTQHDLSLSSFAYWRHKRSKPSASTAIVPVVVSRDPVDLRVEIHLPNGWKVHLPSHAESLHVVALLRELATC